MANSAARDPLDPVRMDRIKTWMQTYVDEGKFPGASVLINQGGTEAYFANAGYRRIAEEHGFARDTIARIYSMTKPIVTAALMTLVERGRVHLDAPLGAILPEFADLQALIPGATRLDQTEPAAPVALHHLLTHTSGLSYGFNPSLLSQEMARRHLEFRPHGPVLQTMIAELAQLPLGFQPGTRWEYSVSIDVIGRVLEVLENAPLDRILDRIIFEPLAMKDTGFACPDDKINRFATLYTSLDENRISITKNTSKTPQLRVFDAAEQSPFRKTTLFAGGGGLVGTIDDFMRFTEMLRNGGTLDGSRILAPGTVDFMMQNHLPGEIAAMGPQSFAEMPMTGMGFGLGGAVLLDPARSRVPGTIGDYSWGGIASTCFWIDRKRDLSVVFFTQLLPSSAYPARAELKALVNAC